MTTSLVRMAQGSPDWHAHRRCHRNASETPIVLGVSPWTSLYALWRLKLGLVEQEVTPAMQRGTDLEPVARAAYEDQTGRIMQPLVVVDGEYSASLDGMTLGGGRLLEIKCPARGCDSSLWKSVLAGEVPEHHRWQIEHQLMITKAEVADLYIFDGTDGILLEVRPDPGSWPRIRTAWEAFMGFVASKNPPPLSKGDVRERNDAEWTAAAAHYLEMKLFADQAQNALAEAKELLVALASHTSETGGGVTVSRYWKAGPIEYRRIPELKALDLEQYRGASREETRITTT